MEMKPVEWITSLLAAIAIIVSIFSWWIARRNTIAMEKSALAAERSAAAAMESNEHTRKQYEAFQEKERLRRDAFRRLYVKRLVKTARQIHDAVLGKYQIDSPFARNPVVFDWDSIKTVPMEVIFADEIMINIFSTEERDKIDTAWNSLDYLIATYGIDDIERQGIGYAGQVIENFNTLIRLFENQ